jgi:hypothetical protein
VIRLSKKGVPYTKDIQRAMVGTRGKNVSIQLDDYEILLSRQKAQSLGAQLLSKVRRSEDRERQEEQERNGVKVEYQDSLPLTGKGV